MKKICFSFIISIIKYKLEVIIWLVGLLRKPVLQSVVCIKYIPQNLSRSLEDTQLLNYFVNRKLGYVTNLELVCLPLYSLQFFKIRSSCSCKKKLLLISIEAISKLVGIGYRSTKNLTQVGQFSAGFSPVFLQGLGSLNSYPILMKRDLQKKEYWSPKSLIIHI